MIFFLVLSFEFWMLGFSIWIFGGYILMFNKEERMSERRVLGICGFNIREWREKGERIGRKYVRYIVGDSMMWIGRGDLSIEFGK